MDSRTALEITTDNALDIDSTAKAPAYNVGDITPRFGRMNDGKYSTEAFSEDELKRQRARQRASAQMLFGTDLTKLDDAGASALYQSVTEGLQGMPDVDGSFWFGDRRSEDPKKNLEMLRDALSGGTAALYDPKFEEYAKASREERLEMARKDEGFWNATKSWLKGERGKGIAGWLGMIFSQPDAIRRFADADAEAKRIEDFYRQAIPSEMDEEARRKVENDILADYETHLARNQPLISLLSAKDSLSDRAGWILTKSLMEGQLDANQLATLDKDERDRVISGYEVIRGEKKHGRILGIDANFTGGSGVGDRAQMMLYGAQQAVIGLVMDTIDFGTDLGMYVWLKSKSDLQERRELSEAWNLASKVKTINENQPLPEGGFLGEAGQVLAENWHWFIPYGAVAKGLKWRGAVYAGEGGKIAKLERAAEVQKAVGTLKASAGITAEDVIKGSKYLGESMDKMAFVADRYEKAMARIRAMQKGLGAKAALYDTQIAAARFMTLSSFSEEFLRSADAAGIDREDAVLMSIAVGIINDRIERIAIPGLGENLSIPQLKAIGFRAMVNSLKRGEIGKYVKTRLGALIPANGKTAVEEAFIEEPLQDLTIKHFEVLAEDFEGVTGKDGKELTEANRKLVVDQLRAIFDGSDLQSYVNTSIDMVPAAFGYFTTNGMREQAHYVGGRLYENLTKRTADLDDGYSYYLAKERELQGMVGRWLSDQPVEVVPPPETKAEGSEDKVVSPETNPDEGEESVEMLASRKAGEVKQRTADVLAGARQIYRDEASNGKVVDRLMDEMHLPQNLAELTAEFMADEELLEMTGDAFYKMHERKFALPDVSEGEFSAFNVVKGSYKSDKDKGMAYIEFNIAEDKSRPEFKSGKYRIVYKTSDSWMLKDDGTLNEEAFNAALKDDSELGKSFDAKQESTGGEVRWANLSVLERKIFAVQSANGFTTGGGSFTMTDDKTGETATVTADSVITLATGNIRDLAFKVLPKDVAEDLGPGLRATGWTVRHETFHGLWKMASLMLSDEQKRELAKAFPDLKVGEEGWEKDLDERMAYEFEQYASGEYIPAKISGKFEQFQAWLGGIMEGVGIGAKSPIVDEEGREFTLGNFYKSVLEGRIGSGNLGIARVSTAPKSKFKSVVSKNELPVEVSKKDIEAQEQREVDDATETATEPTAPTETSAPETASAEPMHPNYTIDNPADASVSNARFYRVSAGDGVNLVGELVISDAKDLKTSYKRNLSDPTLQNRDETKEGESFVKAIAGNPNPLEVGMVMPRANNGFIWTTPSLDTFIGNTRVTGMSLAYENGNGAALKKFFTIEAAKRGIEIPEGVDQPIMHFVLRQIESKDGTATIYDVVRAANKNINRATNKVEDAKNDADILVKYGLIPRMARLPDGRIDTAKSGEAIGRFIQETGAQGMIKDSTELLTDYGQERIQNAILSALLGADYSPIFDKLMTDGSHLDIENEERALAKVAADVMQLAAIKPRYDLRQAIAEALGYYLEWRDLDERKRAEAGKNRHDWYERTKDGKRKRGLTWEAYMGQGDMFQTPSTEARIVGDLLAASRDLRSFDTEDRETDAGKRRAQDLITDFIGEYVRKANAVNTETEDMFGTPPATAKELLNMSFSVGDVSGLFHGSAADWLRPDLKKIGSGQGQAVQGHGLNLTTDRDMAEVWGDMAGRNFHPRTLLEKIGTLFSGRNFIYEASLKNANIIDWFDDAEEYVNPLIKAATDSGHYVDREWFKRPKHRPTGQELERFLLHGVRKANGERLSPSEMAEIMVKAGIDGNKVDAKVPGIEVNYVIYNPDKVNVDHKWKNGKMMFSTGAIAKNPLSEDFMAKTLAKYGLADSVERAQYILRDGTMLRSPGTKTSFGMVFGHDDFIGDVLGRKAGAITPAAVRKNRGLTRSYLAQEADRERSARGDIADAGLIRVSYGGRGLEFYSAPSDEQLNALWDIVDEMKSIIESDGDNEAVEVDFSDAHGDIMLSKSYGAKTSPRAVIEDVRNWYGGGVIPEGARGAIIELGKNAAAAQEKPSFSVGAPWKDINGGMHQSLSMAKVKLGERTQRTAWAIKGAEDRERANRIRRMAIVAEDDIFDQILDMGGGVFVPGGKVKTAYNQAADWYVENYGRRMTDAEARDYLRRKGDEYHPLAQYLVAAGIVEAKPYDTAKAIDDTIHADAVAEIAEHIKTKQASSVMPMLDTKLDWRLAEKVAEEAGLEVGIGEATAIVTAGFDAGAELLERMRTITDARGRTVAAAALFSSRTSNTSLLSNDVRWDENGVHLTVDGEGVRTVLRALPRLFGLSMRINELSELPGYAATVELYGRIPRRELGRFYRKLAECRESNGMEGSARLLEILDYYNETKPFVDALKAKAADIERGKAHPIGSMSFTAAEKAVNVANDGRIISGGELRTLLGDSDFERLTRYPLGIYTVWTKDIVDNVVANYDESSLFWQPDTVKDMVLARYGAINPEYYQVSANAAERLARRFITDEMIDKILANSPENLEIEIFYPFVGDYDLLNRSLSREVWRRLNERGRNMYPTVHGVKASRLANGKVDVGIAQRAVNTSVVIVDAFYGNGDVLSAMVDGLLPKMTHKNVTAVAIAHGEGGDRFALSDAELTKELGNDTIDNVSRKIGYDIRKATAQQVPEILQNMGSGDGRGSRGANGLSVGSWLGPGVAGLRRVLEPNRGVLSEQSGFGGSYLGSFSVGAPVERVHDLVAVHNLSREDIVKALKLGGLPMPSIAITRDSLGHYNYGEISLLFRSPTIDPRRSIYNRIYSGDAYTPEVPELEYEVSWREARRISKRIQELIRSGFDVPVDYRTNNDSRARASFTSPSEIVNAIERSLHDGVVDALENTFVSLQDRASAYVGAAFLADRHPELITDEIRKYVAEYPSGWFLRESVYDALGIRANDGVREEFAEWTRELLGERGKLYRSGVRDDRVDRLKSDGTRRPFGETHLKPTLNNIVAAMRRAARGVDAHKGQPTAAARRIFRSLQEVVDAEDLIRVDPAHDEAVDKLDAEFMKIADRMSVDFWDAAFHAIAQAIDLYGEDAKRIDEYLKSPEMNFQYEGEVGPEIVELVRKIRQMATTYFEAKPERGVKFDEIAAAIIPERAGDERYDEIERELSSRNIPVYRYNDGNGDIAESRKRVLNAAADDTEARFSVGGLFTGSAADYEKPSLLYISTGEGSQVYGWGLYASSERGVAETYASQMQAFGKNTPSVIINGTEYMQGRPNEFSESEQWKHILINHIFSGAQSWKGKDIRLKALKSARSALKAARSGAKSDPADYADLVEDNAKVISFLEDRNNSIEFRGNSMLYEQTFFTNRAPGDESHLLKWYKPVSEENLQRIVDRLNEENVSDFGEEGVWRVKNGKFGLANNTSQWTAMNGEDVYKNLREILGKSSQKASEFLARADIDGIKYPVDSYGKTVKDGDKAGWNYVSFRDDNIRVDRKWRDDKEVDLYDAVGAARADEEDKPSFSVANRKYGWEEYPNLPERVIHSTSHIHMVGHDDPITDAKYEHFKALKRVDPERAKEFALTMASSILAKERYIGKYLLGKHFGDAMAAQEMVRHYYNPQSMEQLKAMTSGERPTRWVYVHNTDGVNTNLIPYALATMLADKFGGEVEYRIMKKSDERNTGAGMRERAGRNFEWYGDPVIEGDPRYFIVDDVWTTGSTTVSLLEYLKDKGADVHGIVTVATASNTDHIKPTSADLAKVLKNAKISTVEEASRIVGFDIRKLTGSEAYAYGVKGAKGRGGLAKWFERAYGLFEIPGGLFRDPSGNAGESAAASGTARPVIGRRFATEFPRVDRLGDDELIVSALAAGMVVNPAESRKGSGFKSSYGFFRKHRKETEMLVQRAHPEIANDYGEVTRLAHMLMMRAQMLAHELRNDAEAGVSESEIIRRLPKRLEPVFRRTLGEQRSTGGRIMGYGMRAKEELQDRWNSRINQAVRVQTGIEPDLFEEWAKVDFVETLLKALSNPRDIMVAPPRPATEPPDEANGDGVGSSAKVSPKNYKVEELEEPRVFAEYMLQLMEKYWRESKGLGESLQLEVWKDAVAFQFARKTAQNVFSKLVKSIVYSGAREVATRNIAKFVFAATPAALVGQMTYVGEIIHAKHIRETKEQMLEDLDKFLKLKLGAAGRFKPDREELRRKVSAELELRARYMRHAMWLSRDAAAEEAQKLVNEANRLIGRYSESDRDFEQSRRYRENMREQAILREFGALKYRTLGEIEDAVNYWKRAAEGSQEKILAETQAREVRTMKAAEIIAKAAATPSEERVESGAKLDFNNYLVGHMGFISLLQDMIRYSSGEDRKNAEMIIDYLALEVQKAGDRTRWETMRQSKNFMNAVEMIYKRPFRKVMADMNKRDDAFAEFMGKRGGSTIRPTRARAMQLLVSLLQAIKPTDDYYNNAVKHNRHSQAAKIAALLSAEDLNMIGWIGRWYEDNRQDLSAVSEELFGIGVYSENPNYFPVKMLIEKQGLETVEGVGWTVFPKALTPRVKNERDFDTGADIFSMWMSRMQDAAQWKAHAKLGLELRGIFGRSELQEAIIASHGAKANRHVLEFITDILSGNGNSERTSSGVEKASDWIRGWVALSALAANVGVMLKQTTSIPAFGFEIGLRDTARHVVTAFTKPGMEAMRAIWESNQRKIRWDFGSSEAVTNALRGDDAGMLKKLFQKAMITNKLGDVVPGLVVGQGIYRDLLGQGMAEEDAMAQTWLIIERTQQSSRMENQPKLQRRNLLGRILYQFLSTQQQYLQYEIRSVREVMARPGTETARKLARTLILNHFILTSLYYWMGELYKAALGVEPPEDQLKDWMIANLLGPFGSLFVLGFCTKATLERALKGKQYGRGSDMIPMESYIKNQVNDAIDLLEAIFDNDKGWDEVVDEAAQWANDVNSVVRDLRKIDKNYIRPEAYKRRGAMRRYR